MNPDEIRVAIRNDCVNDPWTRINVRVGFGCWGVVTRGLIFPIAINYRMIEEQVALCLKKGLSK